MVSTLSSQTFASTYKDDFADSAGFHKILFNSGRALQARELTQLQTILQTQIERFGSNIFKEGSLVKPGGVNLNQNYEFIKLNTITNFLPADASTIVGTSFTGQTSGIVAKVLQVVRATGSDPDTLYVQYTNTGAGGTVAKRMNAAEDMNNGSVTLTVQSANTTTNPAVGAGILGTLLSGIYYVRGHFVFTEDQSKIISKYSDSVTTDLGYKVQEDILGATDNSSLYDNQGGSPNLTAPGADRFRIRLTISEKSEINSDENFIHIATVKKGAIYNAIDINASYNIPSEIVATRIKENSGDYIVKPFNIKFEPDSANTHLLLRASEGVAVVEGYRAARTFPTTLRIKKPTETKILNNDTTPIDFGNYVIVNPSVNSSNKQLPDISTLEILNIRNATNHGGSTIGTCRVKAVSEDGALLRFYLIDLQMNSGNAFRQAKSIGSSGSRYFNLVLESSKAVLKETNNNRSIFGMSHRRPKAITDLSFTVQRRFALGNTDGAGSIALTGLSGETYTNTGDWIIGTDSDIFQPSTLTGSATINLTGSNTGGTISGLPPSQAITVFAYVNKSNPTVRTKSLTTSTITISVNSGVINLFKPDIFDVTSVVDASNNSISYAERFELDNGQRDNHYGLGRLLLIGGQTAPSGNVTVTFRHFTHGASGDFFAVNSYTGVVDYDQIPGFTLSNGNQVKLRNVLDFRSVMDSGGAFSGAIARINELPQPNTLVTSDNEYFLHRAAKLVVDREGVIRFFHGGSGFNPVPPTRPDNTLGLYDIHLNGNTDNDSDLIVTKIEHKRHTMKDISNIEKRIDTLEELTSLNLLELDTKHFQVLDSAGNDRTKSGFFVDNFTSHANSSIIPGEYRAAIDPISHSVRPSFKEDNIRLIYDSASSTNTVRKGDNIYMSFDEGSYIFQNEASKSIRLNPFSVVVYEGVISLSPSSDEWRDVDRKTDRIVEGGTKLNTTQAFNWNNWSWSWGGIPTDNLSVGKETNLQNNMVNRVVSEETVLDLVEDRVLQTAFLPFMRSRKVFFKASGLRPSTQVFAFLNGNNLASFVKPETFQFYGATTTDFGNTLAGITAHPDTPDTLTTDVHGVIEGSFIVPNNDSLRIRTGTREFKLLDVSVNKDENATSVARASYTAAGYLDTKQRTYVSTRVLNVQGFQKVIYENVGGDDGGGDGNTGGGTEIDVDNSNGGGSFDDSGNGDHGGQDKVICTALNGIYGFGSFRNKMWHKYNKFSKAQYPTHKILELGYHKIFGPIAEKMPSSPLLTKIMKRYARVRTDRIKREMTGKPLTLESKMHVYLLRPFTVAVGWLVYKGILSKYKRKGL